MATELRLERCCACDNLSGGGGQADDSLFCDRCGVGPFCDECADTHGCQARVAPAARKGPAVAERGEREELDLGWANSWGEEPEVVRRCKARRHKTRDRRVRPFGHEHEVVCLRCGYVYKYDSS